MDSSFIAADVGLDTVRGFDTADRIDVEDLRGVRKLLGPEHRVLNHGYAVTSYASQGKTVDTVLFSDAGSKLSTNAKQWFVTISRGRKQVLIFTPNKSALRQAIVRDGHRMLATEARRNKRSPITAHALAPVAAIGHNVSLAPGISPGAQGVA